MPGADSDVTPDVANPPAATTAALPAVKPRLRGVLHEIAFFGTLAAGPALVIAAPGGGPRLTIVAAAAHYLLIARYVLPLV